MPESIKKQKELRWLRLCQEKSPEFPHSLPVQSEAPDFLFPEDDLGVEVTEYIQGQGAHGSPERRLEIIQEKLVKQAQHRFEAVHKEQLHVSVFWSAMMQPVKAEQEFLVRGIEKTVTMLLAQGRDCWRPDWTQADQAKLGQQIGQIGLSRLNRKQGYWGCDEAGAVGDDLNRLQTLIRQKDGKVEQYRKKCRHLWLLVVADNKHLSSIFSPDEDFAQATFQTLFDRVFILDVFKAQVLKIRVSQP